MANQEKDNLLPIGMGIDPHASLFKTNEKVLRAIRPKYTKFYIEVLNNPAIQKLIDDNILIPTRQSEVKIEGYDLVLEHPLLDRISYPFEWTPSMYQDATITLLRFNIGLMEAGYCTQDSHLWNILFDGITPKFVDFTSITTMLPGNKWRAYNQFKDYCLYPLLMMQAGYTTPTRQIMREIFSYPDVEFVNKVINSKVDKTSIYQKGCQRVKIFSRKIASKLPLGIKTLIRSWIELSKRYAPELIKSPDGDLSDVKELLKIVASLNLSPREAQWSQYYAGNNELPIYDGRLDVLNAIKTSTPKHALVSTLLEKHGPASVLDLGCNRGLYSQMAALQGARVVGVDLDERALDDMYLDSKRLGTTATPLYINAVAPAEAVGFAEIPFPKVKERLRSELVMCLALVHHLVFKNTRMSFEHISKLFDSYSGKYLLVEFIPIEDKHIQSWYTDDFDWYTLDNFRQALFQYFPKIEIFESFPTPRKLLFCEK